MDNLFVIRNQNNQFLTRKSIWANADETALFFKTPYFDIALNQLIEINAKEIDLRCEIVECQPNEKGLPIVPELSPYQGNAPEFPVFSAEELAAELSEIQASSAGDSLVAVQSEEVVTEQLQTQSSDQEYILPEETLQIFEVSNEELQVHFVPDDAEKKIADEVSQ